MGPLRFSQFLNGTFLYINKVITTMAIRPLDDPHDVLNLWLPSYNPSVWGYVGIGMSLFISRPCIPISFLLTHMVYILPFLSYLDGSRSVSARRQTRIRWQILFYKLPLRERQKGVKISNFTQNVVMTLEKSRVNEVATGGFDWQKSSLFGVFRASSFDAKYTDNC